MANTIAWHRNLTPLQWKTLFAAQLGWALDAMDVMLYAFALTTIRQEFGLSGAAAGSVASVTLLTSAFGGILFGWLADRLGRARTLRYSILVYSIFTALTASSRSLAELIVWRSLVGIGLGGEWSAGSVLVAETWPAEHRGKAIGLMQSGWAIGYILAALIAAAVLPLWGWRVLFAIGVLPALLTLWIRKHIQEPEIWQQQRAAQRELGSSSFGELLQPDLLRRLIHAMLVTSCVLFGYWGLFTWLPAFFSTPVAQGGAGMSIVRTSAWIIPMQIGAFFGYTSFGFLADRIGRKPVFVTFLLLIAALVPIYGALGWSEVMLLILAPLVGFFGHGYFSVFGVLLAELFPTAVRGTAQGFAYNFGRAFSALAPLSIGALADAWGIGSALALTSAFFLLGALMMWRMPETKGAALI